MEDVKSPELGVIVGRFQVHILHDGHLDLIEEVVRNHYRVLIILGLSPLKNTITNPLDFEARKQMILDRFPKVTVLYSVDIADDTQWSKNLDWLIQENLSPTRTAILYGSRDSFVDHYSGKYETRILESKRFVSGTQVRNMLSSKAFSSPDFRAGVIWSAFNRFPTSYQAVDVAPMDGNRVLLGRKRNEESFRFVGGFVDPRDLSLESAALRELYEEANGIKVIESSLRYVGSFRVDDWRYRKEVDKIMSAFFSVTYAGGVPFGDDDIAEVRWFDLHKDEIKIVSTHAPMLEALKKSIFFDGVRNPPAAGFQQNDLH